MTSGSSLHPHTAVGLRFFRCFLVIALLMVAVGDVSLAENRPAWIEVRSPNFIVVTNATERQGRRAGYEFEMIRAVFREFFRQKGSSTEPAITIIAAKDEGTLKALLPEFWAKKGSMHPTGVYLGSTDANYVALRLDVSLNQQAYEPFEPVYHEYVHYLTRRMIVHLPLWMVEGLAEFYGNTRIESKRVVVGAPSTTNVMLLRETPLLPVGKLFDVDASSPYYHEESKTSIFYAESWALTHYLLTRDWKENTHRVADFVALLGKGVDQREAAGRTIGDASSLEPAVGKYIQSFLLTAVQMAAPKIDESGFQARGVSDAESLAVRADFMAHDHHYSEAQAMLEEALKLNPKLGAACESKSFLSLQQGNVAEAEKWAAQAVTLNPQSYWGNYYYAWSLLRNAHNEEESIAKAEASLRTVVRINPAFGPAYDTLAYALALPGSGQNLDEAYKMTLWAVECEPGNIRYRLRAVEVMEQMGKADNAVRVATLAASMAKTPEERTAASEALAGAQQFQASRQKIKELRESQTSGLVDPTTTDAVAGAGPEESAGQTPAGGSVSRATVPVKASAEIEVLSDTEGVDFGPYLTKEVLPRLQEAWSRLAPAVAQPSFAKKKGKTVIEFAIQKNGSVAGMKLKESSNDATLDGVALDGLKAATPFQALPAQFKGKSVALRFNLSFSSVGAAD